MKLGFEAENYRVGSLAEQPGPARTYIAGTHRAMTITRARNSCGSIQSGSEATRWPNVGGRAIWASIYIYIYIYVLQGQEAVHICGVSRSISRPHFWVNNWHPSGTMKKNKSNGFRGFLLHKFSERVSKFSLFSGVLVESRFLKRGMVAIPFSNFVLWWLLVDVRTIYLYIYIYA